MLKYFMVFVALALVNLIRGEPKMAAGNLLGGVLVFPIIYAWRRKKGLDKPPV